MIYIRTCNTQLTLTQVKFSIACFWKCLFQFVEFCKKLPPGLCALIYLEHSMHHYQTICCYGYCSVVIASFVKHATSTVCDIFVTAFLFRFELSQSKPNFKF